MDLVFHLGGTGVFFTGVVEDAGTFELGVLDELEQFVEVRLGLAGEPDDEGGANGDARNASADALDEVADVGIFNSILLR